MRLSGRVPTAILVCLLALSLGFSPAAAARGPFDDYGLPALRNLTQFQTHLLGGQALSIDPDEGAFLPSGAVVFGVQGVYGEKPTPYLAPYSITISLPGKKKYSLALPEFGSDNWNLWREGCASGKEIPVGLEPNAADREGVFWFAVLLPDAIEQEKLLNGGMKIELHYPAPPAKGNPVDYQVEIAAKDGTALATDIYLPYKEKNPLLPNPPYPVTLMRTPYSKDWIDPSYVAWTTRFNAVVVTQYFRGRPDLSGKWPASGGQPCLFSDHAGPDHTDAVDTIEWLRARHWCNGRILPTGPSGLGLWIYQAAPELGDELAGIYPIVAAGDVGAWAAQENGLYKQGNVETWLSSYKFPPELLRQARQRAIDPKFWAGMDFNSRAEGVNCPGLHETTWWDVSIEQGLKSWKAINTRGGPKARGRQWIIIGPWRHDAPRTSETGELRFPAERGGTVGEGAPDPNRFLGSLLESGAKALDERINGRPEGVRSLGHDPTLIPLQWDSLFWIAHVLGRNPLYTPPAQRVLAYFIGEEGNETEPNNSWFELADWPPPFKTQSLYLSAGGKAGDGVWQGTLSGSAGAEGQVRYSADPLHPLPTRGGPNIPLGELLNGPYDQRPVLSAAKDNAGRLADGAAPQVLAFSGEPLRSRLSIAGPVTVKLFVTTDSADTDVLVKLVDIYPDDFTLPLDWQSPGGKDVAGRELLVCDSGLRLSWWCEQHKLGPVKPGRIYEIDLTIGQRAYVFEKGHRIGLQVQGTSAPRFAVNPGTGARFMDDGHGLLQTQILQCGGKLPCRLDLPVYEP